MLTTEISIIGFGVTNVDCSFDTCPCFVHVLSGTCEFEIIHVNNQHAIVLSMIENTLPYIGENLFPTFFSDSAVEVVFPNTATVWMPVQS